VDINFSAGTDTLTGVIARINDSNAGVTARYDSINNRFTLTNKTTGDVGIAVEDVTGNFLAATGLTGASLAHGTDLVYSVNNGPQLTSRSNTITEESSGIAGLSVTALGKGAFDVTVGADTDKIKTAITDFISQYNKVQGLVKTQTASSTDANGKVTAGVLTGDQDVASLSGQLRGLLTSTVSGITGTLRRLDNLGLNANGFDDNLSTTDLTGLEEALATNLSGVKDLFAHVNTGLAARLNSFLDRTIGENGSLVSHQNNLSAQSKGIDKQIEGLEKQVLAYQQQLTNSFVAMEAAQARINEQLVYLQRTFFGTAG
jgi:flagellar hook-associated protein 2